MPMELVRGFCRRIEGRRLRLHIILTMLIGTVSIISFQNFESINRAQATQVETRRSPVRPAIMNWPDLDKSATDNSVSPELSMTSSYKLILKRKSEVERV